MTSNKIFLVGLPGSGKTTFARKLSGSLGLPSIDLDDEIVRFTGTSISKLFTEKGEDYFRQVEHDLLKKIIADNDQFILATGGGTPCFYNNMELMNEAGETVFLNIPIEEIEKRLKGDTSRPLLKSFDVNELLEKRRGHYRQAKSTVTDYSELESLFS